MVPGGTDGGGTLGVVCFVFVGGGGDFLSALVAATGVGLFGRCTLRTESMAFFVSSIMDMMNCCCGCVQC